DLLGDHLEIQRAGELDHGGDHGLIHRVHGEVADERAVDLQIIERQVLEIAEGGQSAPEIIEGELAAHTVQHADEALRVLDVGDHRVLGDLEAQLRGRHAGAIQYVHHELKKLRIPKRLTGKIDGQAAIRWQTYAAATERRQRRLHDPAIDVRHQSIALRGAQELHRRNAAGRRIVL